MRRSTDGYSAVHLCPGCGNCMRWASAEYACPEWRCAATMAPGYCRCLRPVGAGEPSERCRRVLRPIVGGAYRCPNGCASEVRETVRLVASPPEPTAAAPVRSMMADKTRARKVAACPRCGATNQCVVFQHPREFFLCLGCPACEYSWNPARAAASLDGFERELPRGDAPGPLDGFERAAAAPAAARAIEGRMDVATMRLTIKKRR